MSRSAGRAAAWVTAVALAVATAFVAAPAQAAPAPNTIIDSGPAASTSSTTATFTFHSTRNPATFTCSLDGSARAACTSPITYSGLSAGAHTFSVAATNFGTTDPSPAAASWRVDLAAPTAPATLTANGQTPTSVALAWTPATDDVAVVAYDITRDGAPLASVGAVTSYVDGTVTAASTHDYSVSARDAAGNRSPASPTVSATTPATATAPDTIIDSAPAPLTRSTTAQIAFHSTISGSTFTCKLDAGAATACTSPVNYSGLVSGTHTVTVTATASGASDATPAVATWTVDLVAPTAPASLGSTTDGSSVALTWPAATDANGIGGYDVYRGTTLVGSVGAATTAYTDSTVVRGSIYFYTVKAKDTVGNVSVASRTSSIKVLAPYDPHLTRAPYLTDLVGNHVAINFATDRSADSASVVYGVVSGGSCTPTTTVVPSRTSIQVGPVAEYQWTAQVDLPASGTYCYRVRLAGADLLGSNPSPQFTTQNAFGSTAPYSFAVIGDWGAVDANGANEDQANVLAQMAVSGARFAVTVGDNGYPNGSQVDYGDLQQTATSAIFGPKGWPVAGSNLPIFNTVGNHGLAGVTHTDITTWTQARAVASSGGRYQNDSYCCVNSTFAANYGSQWYAFDVGNARFYILDSAWGDTNVGTANPYANDALAHFAPGTPQYEWLVNDLATHTPQLKFAFSHYPLYSDQKDQASDTYLQGAANLEGVLGRGGVQFLFNGHAHIYQRNTASAAGMPVTYVTGGGGGTPQSVGPCVTPNDAYAIGWSPTSLKGSACGRGVAPTSAAQLHHFLKISVSGTSVTIAPTDSTGRTFDVQTYNLRIAPDTYLDSTPPVGTTSGTASFTFHASSANASYTCSLDGAAATSCTSPKTYTGLSQAPHTFKVTARTGFNSTDPTPATWTWTVDSSAPSQPGSVSATATSPFSVAVSWPASSDNTGVTAYDIYRDGALLTSVGAVTSYVDNDVLGASTHAYQVRARDVAGNVSGLAGPASVTTPAPPVPLVADGFESGSLAGWGTNSGVVIQSSTVHGGSRALEGQTTNGATYAKRTLPGSYPDAYARVWVNVLAQPDQVNLLRLRDAAGNSLGYVYVETTGQLGLHNDALGTSTLSSLVVAPGWHALELHLRADSAAGVADGAAEVWLDNARVADLSSDAVDVGAAPVAGLQLGETQGGRTYDVVFDDLAFGTSRLGPVADVDAPTVPSGVTATATSAFSVDVSWTASTDASGVSTYRVLRDGVLVATVDGAQTSWTDGGVLPSSTYAWTVVAVDLGGNASAASDAGTATTPAAAIPVFSDGFESGTFSFWTTVTGLSVQSSTVRNGTWAAEGSSATGVTWAKKTLTAGPYADAYARVGFDVLAQNGGQVTLLRLRESATGGGGFVYLSPGGALGFSGGPAGVPSVTRLSTVVPGPGWHSLELHLLVAGASSTVEVWLDGVLVDGLSGTTDLSTIGATTVLQIGDTASSATGWDIAFDDAAFGTSRLGPTGDITPPTAPALTATPTTPFSVDLSWTASTDEVGVVGYDITRDGAPVASVGPGTTSWTDTSVAPSTTYQYAVTARDAAGNVSAVGTAPAETAAAVAPVFADGFESGDRTAWTSTSTVPLPVQSSLVRTGSFAADGVASLSAAFVKKTLPSSYTDSYARVAFNVTSLASQTTLLRLRNTPTSASGGGAYVYLTTGGKLGLKGDQVAGVTSTVAPGPGWHVVELHLHIGATGPDGSVEVWLDDAPVPDLTFTSIDVGTLPITSLQVGDTSTSVTWHIAFDDAAFGTSRLGVS